jgi:hypothetical protein
MPISQYDLAILNASLSAWIWGGRLLNGNHHGSGIFGTSLENSHYLHFKVPRAFGWQPSLFVNNTLMFFSTSFGKISKKEARIYLISAVRRLSPDLLT